MRKAWTPPVHWIFGAATLLGLFSTLQAYRLTTLNLRVPVDVDVGRLLILNLAYWYVPAALTPTIFRLADRFRLDSIRWGRALLVHALAAGGFSILHFTCMLGVRAVIWESAGKIAGVAWTSFAQRLYLTNLDWALMTYSAIVGGSYALGYYRESQARALRAAQLETRLVEARLRTLEAELHPHFLFNTLHAISTLIHSNAEAADRMISRLSDLLRLTFDRSGAAVISLQEELEFLQKYLEIEQTRFQDRLHVKFDIDPDTLDIEVPRLILQPLVENAITHGVTPRAGEGLVQITARRRGDTLWIEVRDDGVGLSAGERARLRGGIGLSNTRDRLACLYGDAQRLEFSDGSSGLAVGITIPISLAAPGAGKAASRVA
ncbi:MAG TPA: histidine kinase [Vicinamibacterales bacterium]|nr:histidine kinase [Vicinamibacterales bacterium]